MKLICRKPGVYIFYYSEVEGTNSLVAVWNAISKHISEMSLADKCDSSSKEESSNNIAFLMDENIWGSNTIRRPYSLMAVKKADLKKGDLVKTAYGTVLVVDLASVPGEFIEVEDPDLQGSPFLLHASEITEIEKDDGVMWMPPKFTPSKSELSQEELNEIEAEWERAIRTNGCECGAHATAFPMHHSSWCPKHKGGV